MNSSFIYQPFKPSNYDYFKTSNSLDFYVKYPAEGSIEFIFYNSVSETNRVDKSKFIGNPTSMFGIFRDSFTMSHVSILVESDTLFNFNYAYIPYLKRYYFISSVKCVRTNLYQIDLTIDVLMSYKDGIKDMSAFVDRNQYDKDPYIVDDKRVVEIGYTYRVYDVDSNLFDMKRGGDLMWFVLTGLSLHVKVD